MQGSEWHIRQCLLLLHKNYTITADSGKLDLLMQEQAFRAMFFMHSPHSGETAQSGQLFAYHSGARYDELSALLQQELLAQDEFTLPNIHYPKIINMLLLCISRKKYAAEAAFSGGTADRPAGQCGIQVYLPSALQAAGTFPAGRSGKRDADADGAAALL